MGPLFPDMVIFSFILMDQRGITRFRAGPRGNFKSLWVFCREGMDLPWAAVMAMGSSCAEYFGRSLVCFRFLDGRTELLGGLAQ